MSVETGTSITRPDIYPECRGCRVALNVIQSWLSYIPSKKHESIETADIDITCFEKDGKVSLLEEAQLKIQFVESGPVLNVEGGNIKPEHVSCPHFKKKSTPP